MDWLTAYILSKKYREKHSGGGGGGEAVDPNAQLVLMDWEGTPLKSYTKVEVLALEALPNPSDCAPYSNVDHELLLFQEWNWSLADIKAWIQNHEGETLDVGAIYTTTDGADHNYWGSPRLNGNQSLINMCKRGTIDDIGYNEFGNCTALEKISIPYGASSIGFFAFIQCVSLFTITIPNGITNIDNSAFSGCQSLAKVIIPPSLLSMGPSAFNNCLSLRKIWIPDSVTSIGNNAFNNCLSLRKIWIPDSVTSIGNNAFNNCQSLVDIKIPNNITSFESTVFQGCASLPKIHIPGNVISIDNNAFNNCKCLCDIYNECKAALANTNAFNGLPENYRIYVPRAELSWFETKTNWSTIYAQGHIVAIEDYITYLESIGFDVDKYKEAA